MDVTSFIALPRGSNATAHSPSSPFHCVHRVSPISRLNAVDSANLKGQSVGFLLNGEGNLQDGSRFDGDLGVLPMELDNSLGTSGHSSGEDSSSFWRGNTENKQGDDGTEDRSICPSATKIDCNSKQKKRKARGDKNVDFREEAGTSPGVNGSPVEQQQVFERPKPDYIHVRARRGQATDSHSLAERARREKISERMKILQDLVPGCNKINGKAMVLDEIINYIQTLQHQVEFLSMKLEVVDSRMNSHSQGFRAKDHVNQGFEQYAVAFNSPTTGDSGQTRPQEWLHMPLGRELDR